MNERELKTAIAFAQLELLELEHGRRTLTQCPGVEKIAGAIAEAKAQAKTDAFNRTYDENARRRGQYD
jgi:hypothetical protein